VGRGLVASLAHPGGKVPGLTDTLTETEGKRLQLLKEAVPTLSRVAVLRYAGSGASSTPWEDEEAAARVLDVTLQLSTSTLTSRPGSPDTPPE